MHLVHESLCLFMIFQDIVNTSIYFFFFFSSRRRHTRLQGDWSSDVCSSDLRRTRDGVSSIGFRSTSTRRRTRAAISLKPTRSSAMPCAPNRTRISSGPRPRSEEHTSELQSPCNLVCRLLLEKKKQK